MPPQRATKACPAAQQQRANAGDDGVGSAEGARSLALQVPAEWRLPLFFETATPSETAAALDAAASLVPSALQAVKQSENEGAAAARRQGVDEALSVALRRMHDEHATARERERTLEGQREQEHRTRAENAEARSRELEQSLGVAREQLRDAEARGRTSALLECDERLQRELEAARSRGVALEGALKAAADDARRQRDDAMQRAVAAEAAAKAAVEAQLAAKQAAADAKTTMSVPKARGDAGEADVAVALSQLGYRVVDTSTRKDKDLYGDLLCVAIGSGASVDSDGDDVDVDPPPAKQQRRQEAAANHSDDDGGEDGKDGETAVDRSSVDAALLDAPPRRGVVRVAVEVKNRKEVRGADVRRFEDKVRQAVAAGRYEGGIFVSLRCPLPSMAARVRQTLLHDADDRPLAPMAYLCTGRPLVAGDGAAGVRGVTADDIELVTQSHVHLCERFGEVRSELAAGAMKDDDLHRVHAYFSGLGASTTEMFAAFAQHQSVLESARQSLDLMKRTCILGYRAARRLNASVPWLGRSMASLPCERGLDHAIRMATDGRLQWANVTQRDAVMHQLGRECATQVVHEEMRRVQAEASEAEARRKRREATD